MVSKIVKDKGGRFFAVLFSKKYSPLDNLEVANTHNAKKRV